MRQQEVLAMLRRLYREARADRVERELMAMRMNIERVAVGLPKIAVPERTGVETQVANMIDLIEQKA